MIELYKKLGEYGVDMTFRAINEYQIVQVTFEKAAIHRHFVYPYEVASNIDQFERMLISTLHDFMFMYEEECVKRNRAMKLKSYFDKKPET